MTPPNPFLTANTNPCIAVVLSVWPVGSAPESSTRLICPYVSSPYIPGTGVGELPADSLRMLAVSGLLPDSARPAFAAIACELPIETHSARRATKQISRHSIIDLQSLGPSMMVGSSIVTAPFASFTPTSPIEITRSGPGPNGVFRFESGSNI